MLQAAFLAALLPWVAALHGRAPPRPERVDESGQVLRKSAVGPEHRRCSAETESWWTAETNESESVIGGTVVNDPTRFPFLAWLGDNDGTGLRQFCGGSLITPNVVLTAGHCLYESDSLNANMYARFNLSNFKRMPGLARSVINWKRHENYDSWYLTNDVAVLLLNESVPVKPLQLSDGHERYERGGRKKVIGWGSTDEGCMIYDTKLRQSNVPMGQYGPNCSTPGSKTLYPELDFDYKHQICAGNFRPGHMHYPGCGDSGGPLLAYPDGQGDDGTPVQVGMVSWSYGIPYPDVFTRVSAFSEWISATADELLRDGRKSGV